MMKILTVDDVRRMKIAPGQIIECIGTWKSRTVAEREAKRERGFAVREDDGLYSALVIVKNPNWKGGEA